MLIPGIQRNYPEIKKGGKPLFLYGKDSVFQDFRRMFHVKHSGNAGNAGNAGANPADGFAWKKHLQSPSPDFSFWESLEKMI